MTRAWFVLLALAIVTPVTLGQQLPPPRNPAGDEFQTLQHGAALVAAEDAQQQPLPRPPLGAQPAKKNAAELQDLYAARRRAQNERKQAQIDRMKQFKAARAAEQQKLYQDWHERYLADTPVRVEYFRAQAAAYQSQPAITYYSTSYFYGAGPPVILPPVYAPVVFMPFDYGPLPSRTFLFWRW